MGNKYIYIDYRQRCYIVVENGNNRVRFDLLLCGATEGERECVQATIGKMINLGNDKPLRGGSKGGGYGGSGPLSFPSAVPPSSVPTHGLEASSEAAVSML